MNSRTLQAAAARLKRSSPLRPTLAIVLGSGFSHALTALRLDKRISCASIPGFARPTVPGHAGEICFGELGGTPVLMLSGRPHYYEGYSLDQVTFAVRVLGACGIRELLLTNAAGSLNRRFRPGDFMVVTDHINWMGANPLRGAPVSGPSPFVDLTATYDAVLQARLHRAARACGVKLRAGVYLAVSGPSYETPAEVRAFARLGADVVGMSTVPEAIVARHCGMRVAALSCITNAAAGLSPGQLSHSEVLRVAGRVRPLAAHLLELFARRCAEKIDCEKVLKP